MRKLCFAKFALVLAGAFLFTTVSHAQSFTSVSGTVVDPNGIPYGNGTMSAVLTPGTPGGWTLNGQPYSGRVGPIQLDSTGSFTANFGSNAVIKPAGTQWMITVNSNPGGIAPPLGTGPQTFSVTITISGASQNISATLDAAAPNLTNFISPGGGIVSCTTVGGIAFENGTANRLTCEAQLTWDTATKHLIVGPPASSFSSFGQSNLTGTSDGAYSFRSLNDSNHSENIQVYTELPTPAVTGMFALQSLLNLTNSSPLPGGGYAGSFGAYSSGTADITGGILAAIGGSVQTLSNANVAEMRMVDADINHNGTGTVALAIGSDMIIGNQSSGNITDARLFQSEIVNFGTGHFGTIYGFRATTEGGLATNNSYAFYSVDQGDSLKDYVYYSAGGRSSLNAGGGQTNPVLDINNFSTVSPTGLLSLRGAGLGSIGGSPTLLDISTEDTASWAQTITDKSAPAGSYAGIFLDTSGSYLINVSNGTLTGAFTFSPTGDFFSASLTGGILNTGTNCSSAASPAVCSSAPAGSVAMPTNAVSSSIQVNTSAVTANSQIFAFTDDTLGTKLGVTCNSTVATLVGGLTISARVPGTSFTIKNNVAVVTNPLCVSYLIVN